MSIDPGQYERLQQLFEEARELPPARQREYLQQISSSDPALEAPLAQLLVHAERSIGLSRDLEPGGGAALLAEALDDVGAPAEELPAARIPARIGRYRIVRQVGQGGMGAVYEAEQDDPKRRVALKVMRGLSTPDLLERFHREAQMLGRLHHRGISQIYDAHTTPEGDDPPYFVMEFVDGPSIVEFARAQGSDTEQRLELIAEVCDALDHAHQHGLVHRDLKPANILVEPIGTSSDGSGDATPAGVAARLGGQPKILDFGVARGSGLETLTRVESGHLIGTLPYMSPEQAAGAVVDARSDVFSMGVIAFELLVGRLPHDLDGKSLHEAAQVICNQTPPRLGTIDRHYRGDIELIFATALENDRDLRYGTAAQMAADIRHHLAHEPILARRQSVMTRLRKLVKRRRGVAAGVAVAAVAVFVAVLSSERQMRAVDRVEQENSQLQIFADQEAWTSYRSAVMGAGIALENQDPELAAGFLSTADAGRGSWEHRFLTDRLAIYGARFSSSDPFVAASFTATPNRAVTASERTVQWWDPVTGNEIGSVPLPEKITGPAVFDEGGTCLVAAVGPEASDLLVCRAPFERGFLRLAAAEISGALGRTRDTSITSLATSDGGERIAIGAEGVVFWRPDTFERVGLQPRVDPTITTALAFNRDGTRVVIGYKPTSKRGWVCIADFEAGALIGIRSAVWGRVNTLSVPDDGDRPLVGTSDVLAKFLSTQRESRSRAYGRKGWGQVTALDIDRREERTRSGDKDDRMIAIAYSNGSIGVYRQALQWRGHANKSWLRTIAGPGGEISALDFSDDGSGLFATSGNTGQFYSVRELDEPLPRFDTPPRSVAFLDDHRCVVLGENGAMQGWDLSTDQAIDLATDCPGGGSCLATAPAGGLLAVGSGDEVRLVSVGESGSEIASKLLVGENETLTTMSLSEAGGRLAALTATRLSIFECGTGRMLWSAPVESAEESRPLVLSPDGRRVAIAAVSGVQFGEVEGDSGLDLLSVPAKSITALAFSADGMRLAVGALDGSLWLWDVTAGQVSGTLEGNENPIRSLAFAPDGTRLASGSDDGSIVLYETARWEPILSLPGHQGSVQTLSFSPDGTRLASGGADRAVRIWEAPHRPLTGF